MEFDHIEYEGGCIRYIYKVQVLPNTEIIKQRTCSRCEHFKDINSMVNCNRCSKLVCKLCEKCKQCRRIERNKKRTG